MSAATKESPPRRPRRAIAGLLASIALVLAVGAALPRNAARFVRASDEFARVESLVIDSFNSAIERHLNDELSQAGMAKVLQSSVLARWRPVRERWESLDTTGLPEEMRRRYELMSEYIRLRERSWELLIEDLQAVVRLRQTTEEFSTAESFAVDAFFAAVNRQPSLPDAELVEVLESDVLAVWSSARERYESLDVTALSEAALRQHQILSRYIRLREQGWELFRAATLEASEAKFEESDGLQRRATRLLERSASDEVEPGDTLGPKRRESEALRERAERIIEELSGT